MAVDAMTFDVMTEETHAPSDAYASVAHPQPEPVSELYTGIAIFDGHQWAALCKELDIASVGSSAQEALANLKDAVSLALEVAADSNLSAGSEVPEEELRQFMLGHQRQHAITLLEFHI